MFIPSRPCGICVVLVLLFVTVFRGQTLENNSSGRGLQLQYNNAQKLQQAGKLSEAAEEYRAFLPNALGGLAIGYALARDYAQAAPLFDEALTLDPDSPSLLLDYARTAWMLGDLDHARTLAAEFIQKYPGDREKLAQAHQVLGRALLKLDRDKEARKELEAAVALDPTFPNGYDLAVACLDLEDENCAVQLFDELEKSFGDTPEIHMAFGRAYGESDFQARAISEFKRSIAENPRLPGVHYLLAAILLATGGDESHVADAEAELKKELAISPHDAMTYAALGKIAVTRKNYSEAEAYLKKSTLLAPQSPDAYLYLGQMYFNTNRFAEAKAAFRQCIRLTTDISRNRYQVQNAHFLLGRILIQQGKQNEARAEMNIARELSNKTLEQDKSKLAALLDVSGPQDGQAQFSPAHDADPQALGKAEAMKEQFGPVVADSYNNLGAIAATKEDYAKAVTYFEHAALWNPSLDGLDYNWGRAAFAGAQYADAIPPLSRYLKSYPDDTGARSVLGISQFMTGDYQGCIEVLQPVIGKVDLAPQAEYVYAGSLVKTGKVSQGAERLQALEKLHPDVPEIHRSLGEALAIEGEQQQALAELQAAIKFNPRDPESHYDLGKIELERGSAAEAIPELETAVRLSPDSEKFHHALADAYTTANRRDDAQKEIEACNLLKTRAQSKR